jgi:polar amino acid transport system substrate-binding protein
VLLASSAFGQTELRWAADAEGGAPFVEADPSNPSVVRGFDVDVAALVSGALGLTPRFVQVGFTTLDATVVRGDVDLALGGVEDTETRRRRLALSVPYYQFAEILTVREGDRARYRTLGDLAGRRVATLGATLAADVLEDAARQYGVVPVLYEDDVHPYSDLVLGRVDAVVLDQVLAERGVRQNAGLLNQPAALALGHYVAAFSPERAGLRDRVDGILREAMRDGRLEAIFRRWGLWNDSQPALYARVLAGQVVRASTVAQTPQAVQGRWPVTRAYLPSLLRAAMLTLVLSCAAMVLAVGVGAAVALGRIYAAPPVRMVLTAWVEVVRGTPLLLQLFVLYFGLASLVQLPAFVAALIGLGLNYAAYESEIYRSALLAVPSGQLEAAESLGLSPRQVVVLIRAPQALRVALAPMTNDFVALLKDSSLVSVITVVELTKQTSIFASNIGSWLLPGVLCAGLYLALSLPLAYLARRLERTWVHP